ncbi:MAG TPA: hypothetical protein VHE30_21240 [Polyangiaceae bacterium]|nr:hypothetical protein [Polyangiaceae bacterium]
MASDHLARFSYERLLLMRPEIRVDGLWTDGVWYYAVCPDVGPETQLPDGKNFFAWFDHECRAAASPIRVVSGPPSGTRLAAPRTLEAVIENRGGFATVRDTFVDLHLALPTDFPDFTLDAPDAREVVVTVQRALTPEEQATLEQTYGGFDVGLPLRVSVDAAKNPSAVPFRFRSAQGDIDLLPSRRVVGSRDLRWLVEDDDEFWSSTRTKLLGTTTLSSAEAALKAGFAGAGPSCYVNATVSPTSNLRGFLTLYRTVYLSPPLADRSDSILSTLGVTRDEVISLLQTDRLRLVIPQSVDRYDQRWLAQAAEAAPKSILLSRRLAAATVIDTRHRWPVFFPPVSIVERHAILKVVVRLASIAGSSGTSNWFRVLADALSTAWLQSESQLNRRGAMGTALCGIPGLAAVAYRATHEKEADLEIWSAGADVERAGALGASVVPSITETYSTERAVNLVAGWFSLDNKERVPTVPPETFVALDGLLTIDNDAPILPFAKEMAGGDIERLQAVVERIARWNLDPDHLKEAIESFNAEVLKYERRQDRLRTLNIAGMTAGLATAAVLASDAALRATVGPFASLGAGLASLLFTLAREELSARSTHIASAIDFANGRLAGVSADAVLVARMRKEVKLLR